jgi:catechol 2,3-dioxygenase-like lactoylglutathione lyase family enzyme
MAIEALAFAHVNLNCRELARARRFYEQALGLRALVHTDPEPQDCSAFGLEEPGQWDAWMLSHAEMGAGPGGALDLLEWRRPRPLPAVESGPGRLGLRALGFDVPELASARERLIAAGGRAADASGPLCAAWDPEGAPLWLRAGPRPRLGFVELSCRDLERSLRFLREVCGLEAGTPRRERAPGAAVGLRGEAVWRAASLGIAGQPEGFEVELTQWEAPVPYGIPAVEANRQGFFRMALLVQDIERCHAELEGLGVPELSAPAWLDLGPSCPAPSCRALFFRDPDGACLELIEVAAPAPPPPARA